MTVITLSASFGAGGSWVAPELARRLGAPLIDRAIPAEVAQRLSVPLERALVHDEALPGALGRLLASFAVITDLYAPYLRRQDPSEEDYRRETERVLGEATSRGSAVVLGRAGALVLRDRRDALHVRLDGPRERRVAQAKRLGGLDEREARRRLRETDRAREAYVRHFYGAEATDPTLYHLVIDSTAIALDACVEVILAAAAGVAAGGDRGDR